MKKTKKLLSVILCISICFTITTFVQASVGNENNGTLNGKISVAITFTEEEAELYKILLQNANNIAIEYFKNQICENDHPDKISYVMNAIDNLSQIDINNRFIKQPDNSYKLYMQLKNYEININDEEYITDKYGTYSIPYQNDINEIVISHEDSKLFNLEIDPNDITSNNYDIEYEVTFGDFLEGAAMMGNNMNASAQGVVEWSTYIPVGGIFAPNAGYGASKIVRDVLYPNCNKCDKTTNVYISKVDFALQNSDCSTSVKLGVIALTGNIIEYFYYYNSIYCVNESLNLIDNDNYSANEYCNGEYKDGHVNCSWFTGVGHTEHAHYHN